MDSTEQVKPISHSIASGYRKIAISTRALSFLAEHLCIEYCQHYSIFLVSLESGQTFHIFDSLWRLLSAFDTLKFSDNMLHLPGA